MAGLPKIEFRPSRARCRFPTLPGNLRRLLTILLLCTGVTLAQAALQFDVFFGYDGVVPEATWFPIICEIKNDGPSFNGVIELNGGSYQGHLQKVEVELPTGTLKRVVIPVFSTSRGLNTSWDLRLLDEHGKLRGEQIGLRATRNISSRAPLIGALARTPGGAPIVRPVNAQKSDLQPVSARLLPLIFPDNPLVLEGMHALYLNSEKAADLKENQVRAILSWLDAGGHLIVAIEQINDVTASPWLKSLLPCEVKEIRRVQRHTELQQWLQSRSWSTNSYSTASSQPNQQIRRTYGRGPSPVPSLPQNLPPVTEPIGSADSPFNMLPDDFSFEAAELQVAGGTVRDGRVVVSAGEVPLIVSAPHGLGKITVLTFSPEREPVRSWKNLPTFWAKLIQVPGNYYVSSDYNQPGGRSSDGIFGAMLDTRQVHKLPIEWLLVLLILYLLIIGPIDQFWLKRIGRPMLTWITFPCYVLFFSLLIYFIGYKLRAGESEWNELHVVDVLLNGEEAMLRGRTYASVYSPSNQRYLLAGPQKVAAVRGEFASSWEGGHSSEKMTTWQNADSFKAEIFVPVWTSQLFASDWWQPSSIPFTVSAQSKGDSWQITVENHTDKSSDAQIVLNDYVIPLGNVPPNQSRTFSATKGQPSGTRLPDFIARYAQPFQDAVQTRQRAFGATESGHLGDLPNTAMAASFLSQMAQHNNYYMGNFITPPGLDLTSIVENGTGVLFVWTGDYSPVKPMNQFSPRRIHRDTLWRIPVQVK